MPWITRGLRRGIVTTRYPRRADGYGQGFCAAVNVGSEHGNAGAVGGAAAACPTRAISVASVGEDLDRAPGAQVDRGCCILCGRCTEIAPRAFQFDPSFQTSVLARRHLVVPCTNDDDADLEPVREALGRRVRGLRRSVHVRHVDAGSDGSDEWEVAALTNPVYDVQRLGIYFTASPRHADVLLVTGVGTAGMLGPLRHTFDTMPEPRVVVAAGVDSISGGLMGEGYAAHGGICGVVPVDVFVPGSPPSPFGLLYGILLAVGLLTTPPPEMSP